MKTLKRWLHQLAHKIGCNNCTITARKTKTGRTGFDRRCSTCGQFETKYPESP